MDYILNHKIDTLYALKNDISHHDRDILQQPVEEIYNLTEKQKSTWIEHTSTTLKKCKEEYTEKIQTGQKDIRTFFKPRKVTQ